ncbi:MAG TPA: hypothetical protein VER11_35610 [Polyangiaceae bacterium]|nr:hypothetical protein [Polyangiaceae bacterium]
MAKRETKARGAKIAHSLLKAATFDKSSKKVAPAREPLPRPTSLKNSLKKQTP